MKQVIDHDQLNAALESCGSNWSAAQTHGLLCGRLAVEGLRGIRQWFEQVLADDSVQGVRRAECETLLESLADTTRLQLAERQSEFDLLLPSEEDDTPARVQGLADWSEGFLHGLVVDSGREAIRQRLAEEPLSDLIRDLLEMTRASVGDGDSEEENELALTELVEYIRVAAQLAYEHLADLRDGEGTETPVEGSSSTLH